MPPGRWESGMSVRPFRRTGRARTRGSPGGGALRSAGEAAIVQVRDGEVLVSDGPFAETKEQIGGYGVIECADLDAAVQIAAGHPLARTAKVEVRPYWDAPWDH